MKNIIFLFTCFLSTSCFASDASATVAEVPSTAIDKFNDLKNPDLFKDVKKIIEKKANTTKVTENVSSPSYSSFELNIMTALHPLSVEDIESGRYQRPK